MEPLPGGIILCGGQSSRMGQPKAWLPLAGETLLQRAVRTMAEVATPVMVVAAKEQALPTLPREVDIVRDELDAEGPLPAVALGLRAFAGRAETAVILACDLPFLTAETLARIHHSLEQAEAAAPYADGRFHPLAAAYRLTVLPVLLEMQAAGERSLQRLFARVPTARVAVDAAELRNVNSPADYAAARALLGD